MPVFSPDQVNAHLVRRVIQDLVIEYTGTDEITIFQGSTIGTDDGDRVMVAASNLVIDGTTTGANGLDAGSLSSDTWYYIFMIMNVDNGTVAGLLSASMTSPTMPTGYTKKRLVGASRYLTTDFRPFTQTDDIVTSGVQLVSGHVGTSRVDLSLAAVVPTFTKSIRGWGGAYDLVPTTNNPSANFFGYATTDLTGDACTIAIDADPTAPSGAIQVQAALQPFRYPQSGVVSCDTGGGTAGEMMFWNITGYTIRF
jgi:hypothetical protein